ncbi:Pc13g00640, partial [Penicillium rubens Wisconsin 54-1255]
DLDTSLDYLPGHPRIKLGDEKGLFDFIRREVWSEDLESISGRLWWMSKQDGSNISPLHRQRVKGRQIIVTEDPRLHLVWIDDRIFLKTLPQYIMSYVFWDTFLSDPSKYGAEVKLRMAALGYLRTYFYLIQHESDLRIAKDPALSLVPKEVTWPQFCQFTACFHNITDHEVSERYHYGEIRLTRLNYYAPVLLGKGHYQRVNHQYRAYFARIQGPVISAFAFFSILLNCMQVSLAASASDERYSSAPLFASCYWFSTVIGLLTGVLLLMLVLL